MLGGVYLDPAEVPLSIRRYEINAHDGHPIIKSPATPNVELIGNA